MRARLVALLWSSLALVACGGDAVEAPDAGFKPLGRTIRRDAALAADAASAVPDAGPHAPDAEAVFDAGDVPLPITFDYRFDDTRFFDVPGRKEALEAAGKAWSDGLRGDFPPVPAGVVLLIQQAPTDPVNEVVLTAPSSGVLIFVSAQDFAGTVVGAGGPRSSARAEAAILATLSARSDGFPYRPWAGVVVFDSGSDFHVDATGALPVPLGQIDFFSVAAHEIGHVLGFSATTPAFSAQIVGGTFVGAEVQRVFGAPVPLSPDLSHFAPGNAQRPLMESVADLGRRYVVTALDRAVLLDLGYSPL